MAVVGYFVPLRTYFWRVKQVNAAGESDWTEPFHFYTVHASASEHGPARHDASRMYPVYPNPAENFATIRFVVSEPGGVDLRVYDMLGAEVAMLFSGFLPVGEHALVWHVIDLANGLYVVRFVSEGAAISRAVVVAR